MRWTRYSYIHLNVLKFHTRDLQKVLVTSPLDSVHQDLVGGQNIVPEDCKCAGEHPEQSSEVYPTVAPQVQANSNEILCICCISGLGGKSMGLVNLEQYRVSGGVVGVAIDGKHTAGVPPSPTHRSGTSGPLQSHDIW